MHKPIAKVETGKVYCPMCTHTVDAEVYRAKAHGAKSQGANVAAARGMVVKPGQKCPHCSAPLDAGYIFRVDRAA